MNVILSTAAVAKLIAEPARADMLISLMDGRALTATELANGANISPQTASSHLAQLLHGNLLVLEKQGRHRYYRIANTDVAIALEALMSLTPAPKKAKEIGLEPIHFARSCYDHIAGSIGVALADSFLEKDWLVASDKDYIITKKGEQEFENFGIDLVFVKKQRRHFARQCLDWTERRHHVGGALGAAIMSNLLERKWLKKDESSRVLYLTNIGIKGLETHFGVHSYQALKHSI